MMEQPNNETSIYGDTPAAAAFSLVLGERLRQQQKGYDAEHDADHTDDELMFAGIAMAIRASMKTRLLPDFSEIWPFCEPMPQMKSSTRDLVIAASFLVAEIERRLTLDE